MSNSLDPDDSPSYLASHLDPYCLHMALWLCLAGYGLITLSTLSNSFGYLLVLFASSYKLMNQYTLVFLVFKNFYGNISNSADLDQRAPTGALCSVSTMFEIFISAL